MVRGGGEEGGMYGGGGRGEGMDGGIAPLGGIPSMSEEARARAVWASLGREVRISDAERGRGREVGLWSSGMGAGVGAGGVDICWGW